MVTAFRFLLRLDLVIVQPVVGPVKAMGKTDFPAAFLSQAMETDSRRAFAAVSFAVRFSPETGPFAVVLFGLCRFPRPFATAGFVPAADPFDPGFAAAVVVVAAAGFAAAAVVDLSDLSAAGLSVFAAGPGSVGFAVFAADPAFSVCLFAVAMGKEMVVAAVPFCFLTHRSSF